MSDRIRIIKHQAVPGCGSFDVRFPDDRPSQYFYWDDSPDRRLRPDLLDRETALEKAKAVVRQHEIAKHELVPPAKEKTLAQSARNCWRWNAFKPRAGPPPALVGSDGPS
jgi:hypothetical protein